jgi:hypothetical protein
MQFTPMRHRRFLVVVGLLAAGCSPSPQLPPLLQDASTTGGSNFLCHPADTRGGQGTTPGTVSHSPQIVARLHRDFPVGSPSDKLVSTLRQQGFTLHRCEVDNAIGYALFSQKEGFAIMSYPASASIYWKADTQGRLIWTTGDIGYRGL